MKEKFRTILELIEGERRISVALFALLKMDDLADRWTVLYSDQTVTDENRKEAFDIVLDKLKAVLTSEELASIVRIGLLTTKDHLTECLLRYRSGIKIQNEKVNGNFIHEGYIIKADNTLVKNDTDESSNQSSANLETPKNDPRN